MAGSQSGRVAHGEKNSQNDRSARGSGAKAAIVTGPAVSGKLGGKLQGGFVTGDRKARGKA